MSYEARIDISDKPVLLKADPRLRLAAIVIASVLVAALLRFWGIGSRALWLDESYSAWFSELGWKSLWFESPTYETHPPFYYSLLKLWRGLAGDDAAALRGLSAVAGIATIPILALAGRDLGKLIVARRPTLLLFLICALSALSPRLVIIAQDARPYALLLGAYALALAYWLRLTISFRSAEHKEGRLRDWIGLGVGTALTLWLHFIGLLFATALFGALLLTAAPGASRLRWQRLGCTCAGAALLYLPCLAMLLSRSGDWNNGWVLWDPLKLPGALLDLYGLFEQGEVWTPIAARILFAGLIAAGLRAIWRRQDRALAFGLGGLILFPPIAAALLSQLGHPVFVPRTLVAVLAPAYLAAAYGLTQLGRRAATMIGGLTALILLLNLAQTLARPSLEPWDEVAATLHREMSPGDVIWAYPNDSAFPLRRAMGNDTRLVPLPAPFPALQAKGTRPAGSPAVVAIDAASARAFSQSAPTRTAGTIWLVVRNPGLFDPGGKVARALGTGRRAGAVREWRDIELRPLHPE